jgi:hypothetical protein
VRLAHKNLRFGKHRINASLRKAAGKKLAMPIRLLALAFLGCAPGGSLWREPPTTTFARMSRDGDAKYRD